MDKHDKRQIKQLREFKKWFMWYITATEEEKREYLKTRWESNNESH